MGSSDTAQRARTKAPDFSELFRSANGSRHAFRTGAGSGCGPSSTPRQGENAALTKAASRRSMLPFLGRKKPVEKPAEQPAPAPALPLSRKSVGNPMQPVSPVNTVRRSFGNGHAVLMITPSGGASAEPPSSSKLPSTDPQPSSPHPLSPHPSSPHPSSPHPSSPHPSSLGSKLAAHFTPLRTPVRHSKARNTMIPKPDAPAPQPSPALSPRVPEIRAPSIESHHSSMHSRSTTPRPLRGSRLTAAGNGDEEDFSDLFTLPDKLKKPQQSRKTPSTASSVHISLGDSPKKSGELTPTTPVTPLTSSLHFPIPPSTIFPRSTLREKGFSPYSTERASLLSQGSGSPSTHLSPGTVDNVSARTLHSDASSQDERRNSHCRTASVSGSDTDTSRANDSTQSASSSKHSSRLPKPSSGKPKQSASNGPPPSVPLPTPPLSPDPTVGILGTHSVPSTPPNRLAFPRPRANTLSVTSNLMVPGCVVPKSNNSSPPRSPRADWGVVPDVPVEELQEALAQECRRNAQLQEYIGTITKRYEGDRIAMTKTIEKLERNIRKKLREIEGLRWLVIHNGAVSDIDAAANLARSSLSTQDGDVADIIRRRPPLPSSSVAPSHHGGRLPDQSVAGQRGESIAAPAITATSEFRSDMSMSVASFSTLSETTSLAAPSLSMIPERTDGITRAERQKLKEERRASKALRRISTASTMALGTDPSLQASSTDSPLDPNFDPQQHMDEVLEKLQPFRHT